MTIREHRALSIYGSAGWNVDALGPVVQPGSRLSPLPPMRQGPMAQLGWRTPTPRRAAIAAMRTPAGPWSWTGIPWSWMGISGPLSGAKEGGLALIAAGLHLHPPCKGPQRGLVADASTGRGKRGERAGKQRKKRGASRQGCPVSQGSVLLRQRRRGRRWSPHRGGCGRPSYWGRCRG